MKDYFKRMLGTGHLVGAFILSFILTSCMNGFVANTEKDPRDARPWDGASIGQMVSKSFSAPEPEMRLLTSREYLNTIWDLLGIGTSIDPSSGIAMGDKLHDSLFTALVNESRRLADQFVSSRVADIYPCYKANGITDNCVRNIIAHLGKRAFRRPVTVPKASALFNFYKKMEAETSSSVEGLKFLVSRILMSPEFLYRQEVGKLKTAEGYNLLDDFERASFISYSVAGTTPDDELLADAEAGKMDSKRIRYHVRRILQTPKGKAQTIQFFKEWLRVEDLDRMSAEPEKYPKLSSPLADSLKAEFETYIEDIIYNQKGNLRDLLTSNTTYVNQHTAPIYGLTQSGDQMVAKTMDPSRKGVLALASFLTVHASVSEEYKDRPVRRGLVVKNQMLCERVGIPSGISLEEATNGAIQNEPNFENLTVREQFEVIMEQEQSCISCHSQFMPYGYVFSNFDAMGKLTTSHKGRAINSQADVTIDRQVKTYQDSTGMIRDLAESPIVRNCFTKKFTRFTSGAGREDSRVTVLGDQLSNNLSYNNYSILFLIEDVMSAPELYLKGQVSQ